MDTGVDLAANVFLLAIFLAGSTLSRSDLSGGAVKNAEYKYHYFLTNHLMLVLRMMTFGLVLQVAMC